MTNNLDDYTQEDIDSLTEQDIEQKFKETMAEIVNMHEQRIGLIETVLQNVIDHISDVKSTDTLH